MSTATMEKTDRVQRHTAPQTAEAIERAMRRNVREHAASAEARDRRIAELEREWDVERTLEANASTLALAGAVLGTTVNKKWFWLTGGVLGFLFQHATSGWCPPLPILRKLGVRTQSEIDQERHAIKAIRGDFPPSAESAAGGAVSAVSRSETVTRGGREPDRIRRYTTKAQAARIDSAMLRRVRLYSTQPREVIAERIQELKQEWSIERYLQINVAAVGLTTAALAITKDRRWGYATCAGLAFFLLHATDGFDPPLPALRRAGVRSRAEINQEIYALKVLRGDFDQLHETSDEASRVEAALRAVAE